MTMLEHTERFDMKRPPMRMHLRPLIWALALPGTLQHRNKLQKIRMEGIKPPYLLLCNHNAFMDFTVATKATFPHRVNYVVAIDGYLKREWLLRLIGCICKRKFTKDIQLIRQLRRVVERRDIAAIYPEARYSLCGTTAVLPASIGKLAKLLKVPVVTLMCHGHHVNSPFWNTKNRGLKGTEAELTCLFTKEELEQATHEEVTRAIEAQFRYDDFRWQQERGIPIKAKYRAEGLHKVLYQCPCCGTEYRMSSAGTCLTCDSCGAAWELTELGSLEQRAGEKAPFTHIPDWYEWERANVRREVEAGAYRFHSPVRINALPNAKGFLDLGEGKLTHDMTGFTLTGNDGEADFTVHIPAQELYSCHIEYEYLGKYGDCVDLNTDRDTLYLHPLAPAYSVTKLALATEELYALYQAQWEAEREQRRSHKVEQ